MDNMAYLQQIAGVDNSAAQQMQNKGGDSILKKVFNIWTLLGTVILVAVLIIAAVVVKEMNKVDTKDQDLMAQSYWTANFLQTSTIKTYSKQLKNSDLRNMTASLSSVLSEIMNNDKTLMLAISEIDVSKLKEKEDATVQDARKVNNELNSTLETARISGLLDRVYLREMTMQIAYLRAYQSEIAERTKDDNVKTFSTKAEANLANLYEQFHNFKSNTI